MSYYLKWSDKNKILDKLEGTFVRLFCKEKGKKIT